MNLQSCELCNDFSKKYSSSAKIITNSKPSLEYSSHDWIPKKVKILFIAESPPPFRIGANTANDGFFYNVSEVQRTYGAPAPLLGTLSWNLFWLLDIDNKQKKDQKLKQFKDKACYFVETIKCRTERYNNKVILNKTVKQCSKFLAKDLAEIKPNTIVILGERALYGLKCIEPFKGKISSKSINALMELSQEKPLIIGNYQLFFLPLPIWRNRLFLQPILEIFEQIKKMI